VDKKERGFGRVVVGWCGIEELEVSPGSADMSARDGRVEFDVESEIVSGRPLDVKQRHTERRMHV
jgi:hypothetical protein